MVGAFGFATFIPPYQGKDVVWEPHRPSLMTFSSDVRLARGRGDEARVFRGSCWLDNRR